MWFVVGGFLCTVEAAPSPRLVQALALRRYTYYNKSTLFLELFRDSYIVWKAAPPMTGGLAAARVDDAKAATTIASAAWRSSLS